MTGDQASEARSKRGGSSSHHGTSRQRKMQQNRTSAVSRLEAEAGHVCGPGLVLRLPATGRQQPHWVDRPLRSSVRGQGPLRPLQLPSGTSLPPGRPGMGRLHGDDIKVLSVGGPGAPHGAAQPRGEGEEAVWGSRAAEPCHRVGPRAARCAAHVPCGSRLLLTPTDRRREAHGGQVSNA